MRILGFTPASGKEAKPQKQQTGGRKFRRSQEALAE